MSSLAQLQNLIHDKYGLDPAQLDPHASLSAAGIDSLTQVELVFAIEERFGVAVPEKDSQIDTLAELAVVVDRLLAAAQPS